ncbi:hypothetical protein BHE74_00016987 [Ensete ventricosum]|nr:hypothetical protein BHE74_00016987 [Ensete ventricosum]
MGLTRFTNAGPFISFSPTPRSLISATRVRLGSTHRLFGAKPKPTLASSHIVSSSRVSVLLISHSPSSSPSETLEEEEDVGRLLSAEQDTRFSNKQAKLLKTQKFAPVLDHPFTAYKIESYSDQVDMTKVKMDVIRPWIATRATELLGFEDEVLINFVYGLLDGKACCF